MQNLLKALVRRWVYPVYIFLYQPLLRPKYSDLTFEVSNFLWGQRGNDYASHRRKVDHYLHIRGSEIFVAGCGTGRDIESWLVFGPKRVVGVDLFNYENEWSEQIARYRDLYPETTLEFFQGDLSNLSEFYDTPFDIVASDAVFEHVTNLPIVLHEFTKIMKSRSVLYATYGPLWFSFGGDHVSGYDNPLHGYNHLLLQPEAWNEYLAKAGDFEHSEDDGRTWINADLFSKLRPDEYINYLNDAGFERCFTQCIVDPRAVKVLKSHKILFDALTFASYSDLTISGMTIIFRNPIRTTI